MDQTGVLVESGIDVHPEISLVALFGLMHLGIEFPLFVLGGTRCRDEGDIDDGALAHRYAPCAEVGFDRLKDLLLQIVLLKKVAEGQDRRLSQDLGAEELDAGKLARGGHLDQGLFYGRFAE